MKKIALFSKTVSLKIRQVPVYQLSASRYEISVFARVCIIKHDLCHDLKIMLLSFLFYFCTQLGRTPILGTSCISFFLPDKNYLKLGFLIHATITNIWPVYITKSLSYCIVHRKTGTYYMKILSYCAN